MLLCHEKGFSARTLSSINLALCMNTHSTRSSCCLPNCERRWIEYTSPVFVSTPGVHVVGWVFSVKTYCLLSGCYTAQNQFGSDDKRLDAIPTSSSSYRYSVVCAMILENRRAPPQRSNDNITAVRGTSVLFTAWCSSQFRDFPKMLDLPVLFRTSFSATSQKHPPLCPNIPLLPPRNESSTFCHTAACLCLFVTSPPL